MRENIIIGSRGSRLALTQAESVVASLKEANPSLKFSLTKIITEGDRHKKIPLNQMSGRGVFVKEVEEALLDGKIDLAVHSLKDLPTQIPHGLSLAAVTKRLDPRDAFVSRGKKLGELAPGSIIGTGSLRRTVQLLAYYPALEVRGIRGNIDTRLRKVFSAELDGVIVAAAAMTRLGWKEMITEYLSLENFLPEVGQGALAIEIRSEDKEIAELVCPLNHEPTWRSIVAERTFLRALGGGCRAPIAALGVVTGNSLRLQGMVAHGSRILYASEEGNALIPEVVGMRLAQRMLEMGASQFITEAKVW
ncbi:MAG: hydroxymethylbilane synthase [Dehalococcoidales bacterium]|nr:hydroxymethylbilane synthase [Dehalococcoidales bacterium]